MTRPSGGTESGRSPWIACALIASVAAHAADSARPAGRSDPTGPGGHEPEPPILLPPVIVTGSNLELAVGASNLFDEDWYVHSRGGFFGPGLAAGPPRQTYGSLGVNMTF